MNGETIKVLLVEDNPGDVRLIREALKETKGFQVILTCVGRLDEGLQHLEQGTYDALLLDLMLPDSEGPDTFTRVQRHSPNVPIVLLTGLDDEAFGLEAVRRGAQDYLVKGKTDSELLSRSLRYAIERRHSEDALRESEERFRSIAENAADAIVVINGDGSIRYWNRIAESTFSYQEEEVLGKPLSSMLSERHLNLYQKTIKDLHTQVTNQQLGKVLDIHGLKKDGEEFPIVLSLSMWEVGGEKFFSAIIRDMTEVRESQQRAQLQDRLAAVGQLAAGIAHDFNNILGTITIFTELLEKSAHLDQKDHERVNVINQQAQQAALLISQILDFSRRAVMDRQAMDIVPFLEEIVKLLKRTLPLNIHIELISDQREFIVNADPTRMQQMITNLALNARDAMQSGGDFRIKLSRFTARQGAPHIFEGMTPGDWLKIQVTDTGTGIPGEILPHIFEPFFTTKAVGKGTGLGLAQVYGIVTQHEGFIDVTSSQAEGTDFSIYLPLVDTPVEPLQVQEPSTYEVGQDETILVVEDDVTTRHAMCEILGELNYQTLMAADGHEALAILETQSNCVDLVISDLVMPNFGGVDLHNEIRETFPDLPIIIMTGRALDSKTQNSLRGAQTTWIQKPLSSDIIAQAVGKALVRESTLASDSGLQSN